MVFCKACARDLPGHRDADGLLSCSRCGKVLKFDNFSNEVTFVKSASGQSQLSGRFVRSIEAENQSRERLYEKARDDLTSMKNGLGMGENMAMVDQAMKYYRIAVERNFTKGRRTEQVQAACLYIACRENRKPYLLIEFSIFLKINVYVLGAVFLQLCKVLNLTEHPICQKLQDPSIFIHKYTASLAGGKNKDISQTALNIIASMNRDWLQTGRKPSGLWGAAVYVSALAHGLDCSKDDILQLVHVCEATLTKRLVEFENTESGSLTIEELNAKAEEMKESAAGISHFEQKQSSRKELLCQHKGTSIPPFAYQLCQDCFAIFVGFEGGSDPPAFQRAEKQRMQNLHASEKMDYSNLFETDLPSYGDESLPFPDIENGGPASSQVNNADTSDEMHGVEDTSSKVLDESDTLSDIDDAEVDVYLHNEEEKRYKKIIWENLNREYLEEQAAKEAAVAAAKEAWEANYKNCPEDVKAAKDFEANVVASRAKFKKERQQQRAAEMKNLAPPKSAAEAAHRMLTKKRPSAKINYDALEKLFDDEPGTKDTKKMRTATHSDNNDLPRVSVDTNNDEDAGQEHDNDDVEDDGGAYVNNFDDYDVDDAIYHDDDDSDYNLF